MGKPKFTCAECNTPITKPERHTCRRCGRWFCGKHIYSRVDGNNGAITRSAHEYCQECVEKQGGSLKD